MRWAMALRIAALVCLPLLVALPGVANAAAPASLEYAVKATFLYKFVPFVDWPASAFASPEAPVSICTLGSDPVTQLIDQAASGQRVGERAIVVRHLQTVARDAPCHVLYIAEANPQQAVQALNAVRGTPVLTVTDSIRNASAAGIVSFVLQDNRVRFDIDAAQAAANGLSISSRLLTLARTVRPAR